MATITSNTLVIIIVVAIFLIADVLLSVFIIIESGKYNNCKNKESGLCLSFACPYPFDTGYVPFSDDNNNRITEVNFSNPNQTHPNPSIGANKCLGYPYRIIDKTKGYSDDNIECRIPSNGGVNTQTPTTRKNT